jgi:uncharacterized protein YbaR (Trm112 family)
MDYRLVHILVFRHYFFRMVACPNDPERERGLQRARATKRQRTDQILVSNYLDRRMDYSFRRDANRWGISKVMKTEPNQALQTMTMLVTPAASHLSRQAQSCLT